MRAMRRAVLATFLCAAPLLAAPAQASTGMLEREALREVLRQRAHSSRAQVVALPLSGPPRALAVSISRPHAAVRSGASLTIVTAPRNGTEVVLAWEPSSLPTQVHVAS